jgi:hypothetical protein
LIFLGSLKLTMSIVLKKPKKLRNEMICILM